MSEGAIVEKKGRTAPRKLPALDAKTAASAKGDPRGRYELRDSGKGHVRGLGLVVQPTGSKTWVLRYEAAGVPRKLTLEPYSDKFGLAAARQLAASFREKKANGADPARDKAEARHRAAAGIDREAMFSTAWGDWKIAPKPKSRNLKGWRASTALRVDQEYEGRLKPIWSKRRLNEIAKADVSRLINGIAKDHPHAAARLHRVLASFFNWCVAEDRLEKSPCDGIVSAKRNKRKRKLTDDELRWLWMACAKDPFPMGYFVRLLILTLARRNEVAGMCASELHMGNRRTWMIPAERTKNHHEHEIFLTDAMLEIINTVPKIKPAPTRRVSPEIKPAPTRKKPLHKKDVYLFATTGKGPFSGFSKAKKRLDAIMLEIAQAEDPAVNTIPNWTLHDLRRTGSTRLQRLGFDKDVVDACINHLDEDSYKQHDYAEEKVAAIQAWSAEILRIVGLPRSP